MLRDQNNPCQKRYTLNFLLNLPTQHFTCFGKDNYAIDGISTASIVSFFVPEGLFLDIVLSSLAPSHGVMLNPVCPLPPETLVMILFPSTIKNNLKLTILYYNIKNFLSLSTTFHHFRKLSFTIVKSKMVQNFA